MEALKRRKFGERHRKKMGKRYEEIKNQREE